jgi:hypothetical protein
MNADPGRTPGSERPAPHPAPERGPGATGAASAGGAPGPRGAGPDARGPVPCLYCGEVLNYGWCTEHAIVPEYVEPIPGDAIAAGLALQLERGTRPEPIIHEPPVCARCIAADADARRCAPGCTYRGDITIETVGTCPLCGDDVRLDGSCAAFCPGGG